MAIIYSFYNTGDPSEPNWNHIASLSGSDFDLAAHGDHQDISDISRHVVTNVPKDQDPSPAHV